MMILRTLPRPFLAQNASSILQHTHRLQLLMQSSIEALIDPTKQEKVAAVGELMPFTDQVLDHLLNNKMLKSHDGRRLLRERPVISTQSLNMNELQKLPANTFGRRYWEFLDMEKVSPDTRAPVQFLDQKQPARDKIVVDPMEESRRQARELSERAYLMLRYRQIHDFLHTLTNVPTTLAGELALKWFEFMQFQLPMSLMAGIFGPVRLLNGAAKFQDFDHAGRFAGAEGNSGRMKKTDMQVFMQDLLPWAIQSGSQCAFLLSQPWEQMFDRDLQELQQHLNIIPYQQRNS